MRKYYMLTIKQTNLHKEKAVGSFFIDHPMPVHTCMLNVEDNKIIEHFLKIKNTQESALDNISGWTSDFNIHETQPIVLDLFKQIIKIYTKEICPIRGNPESKSLTIDANMWFSEYLPEDYADEHFHTCLPRISFVYYLDCEQGSSPLTFCQKHHLPYGEYKTVKEIDLEIKQGMCVFFPSFLYHKVAKTSSKRFVIAGNILDVYGE